MAPDKDRSVHGKTRLSFASGTFRGLDILLLDRCNLGYDKGHLELSRFPIKRFKSRRDLIHNERTPIKNKQVAASMRRQNVDVDFGEAKDHGQGSFGDAPMDSFGAKQGWYKVLELLCAAMPAMERSLLDSNNVNPIVWRVFLLIQVVWWV